MPRPDRRAPDALRPYAMQRHFQRYPAGSVLIEMGATRVICAASVEDRVPFFQRGTGEGWIAAEYSLLPSATSTRTQREAVRGRQNGRTQEIQRLIGRALRSVVDMKALGERTIQIGRRHAHGVDHGRVRRARRGVRLVLREGRHVPRARLRLGGQRRREP